MADTAPSNSPPPPYASLINRGLITPGAGGAHVSVDWHYFSECHRARIETVVIDESWYLDRNPDIRPALAAGKFRSAAEHYREFGYYEHRMPYPIVVDEEWYLKEYSDIAAAVSKRAYASGQAHFEELGFKEGRMPFKNFQFKTQD